MLTQLEELNARVDKMEKQRKQEVLTIVEILSNATFFVEVKKANCEYTKNGQCSFFILKDEAKDKIPIVTDCRITHCKKSPIHCHLELSNITCALCQISDNGPTIGVSKRMSRKSKNIQNIGSIH
jgi:hypothetical protein